MIELLRDVLTIEDVRGVMLLSPEGKLVFKQFRHTLTDEPETRDWWGLFIHSLKGIGEAEFIFDGGRIYLRKTDLGYLLVLMGDSTPFAMLRLNCDIILPKMKQMKPNKGLRSLLRKFG
jgi:hypothetical protein